MACRTVRNCPPDATDVERFRGSLPVLEWSTVPPDGSDLDRRCAMRLKLTGFALAGAVVLALGASVALAAGGLAGTYTTTVKSPAQLKGKWAITFAKNGMYTVAVNGEKVARGRYTSTAGTVTLDREQGSGCTGAGTYAWKRSGKTLTFVRKRESASCQARALVLGQRFTQVR
jgi:hypothetical protein